jgi:integrase
MSNKQHRSRGEGTYWVDNKKKLHRWRLKYENPLTGKKSVKNLSAHTRKELVQRIDEFRKSLEQDAGEYKGMTLSVWLDRWLETKKVTKKSKTYRNYEGICQTHIKPVLGEYLVQRVRKEHVQSLFNSLAKKYSPSTVASVKRVFRAAMNAALDAGIIDSNPVLRTETPTVHKRLPVALEETDMLALFRLAYSGEFLPDLTPDRVGSRYLRRQYFVALCLSMATGMRKGELFALTWDRIKEGTIRVDRSLDAVGNSQELTAPKTDSSIRYVLIPEAISSLLNEWHREQTEYAEMLRGHYDNSYGLVFTNTVGKFVSPTNLYKRWWDPLRKAAGLPTFKWHNIRSACLSYFAAHGTDMRTVGHMAGHSDTRTTMAYYIGITTDQERRRLAVAEDWAIKVLPPK